KGQDIGSFIEKYQNEDFSEFRGASIAIRQGRFNETRYMVTKIGSNLPVYFVIYNEFKDSIEKINKSLLQKEKINDYFTDEEIKNLINNFRRYDFGLLGVDNEGNVLINPFEINSPAILLRVSKQTGEKEIRKGYVFKHYKGNWYIRK
ncbi:MAG: hypothetical protein LBP34_08645, partial [Flavobacteriaceae bacterium]|nr:hypothetical protein [Flavobacteriaceae bacterium]